MDISSILNIGMGVNSPDFGSVDANAASEISFGDILGSAVTSNTPVDNITQEVDITEDKTDENNTFSKLVSELAQDVSNADKSVIDAAVKMMLSVGNAAEKFMYGTSDSSSQGDDENTDIINILSNMIKFVTSQDGEDFVSDEETGLALTLGDISAVLETGLSEGKSADEIADEMKKLAESDDTDLSAIANAVVSMMDMMPVSTNEEILDEIPFEAAAKAASVTEVLSSDTTPVQKAETIVSILENKTGFNDLPSFESFQSELKLALYSDNSANTADTSFAALHKTATFARINDVSAQIRVISGSDENSAEQAAANVVLNAQDSVQTNIFDDIEIPTDTAEVYRQLADFAVQQITQSVSETTQNGAVRELVVVLKPENLGEVAVKITSDTSGAVSVVLAASNEEVGRALAANSAALTESFAKQNVDVQNVNVVAPSEAASYMGLDFSNQSFNRRNDEASQSENASTDRIRSIAKADNEAESGVTAARKLLKEAKLWLTA
ncbi:MAG: flagellar hook-length control protein FliK [Oscillospiraceae bacterium]|nr:flagellar hook-length control protein FliK [Oscillospiraceae bacterium]